jgi:predicted nucleotidyltransferase
LRELASVIDESPGNLSRELKKLEEEGLFTSLKKGSLKYFSLNKKYPLFDELKKIISKTEGVEGSLKVLVSRYKGIVLALIYGSYAKNGEKKTSDIDLIVAGKIPENKFTRDIHNLELKLNREINFTVYSEEEFERERKKEGGFLSIILDDAIILLKGELHAG